MKGSLFVALIFCVGLFTSCKKSGSILIEGKWNVVNDDITSNGRMHIDSLYVGEDGDYFDFRMNDSLYIKENFTYDTIYYKVLPGNKLILPGIGITLNNETVASDFSISDRAITIVANPSDIITPAGSYQRTIHLKK